LLLLLHLLSVFTLFYSCYFSIPVFVMLPLNSVNNDGTLNNAIPWEAWFSQLRDGRVGGIMVDVWWGIVEANQPRSYNWNAYKQLFSLCQKYNLKVQATMSFHQCGGNVGDQCNVNLPNWVLSVGNNNPDIFYTDQHGNRDHEYLTCGVDDLPLFSGRTPVRIYTDYIANFVRTFQPLLASTIVDLQIGLGPAGEMRYPSYQLKYWNFPGVGEFQCYDRYLLASLNKSACAAGHCYWGLSGPNNAGSYNCNPCTNSNCAPFFTNGFDNYASPYGQFFLNWYSNTLISHGEKILSSIRNNINIPAGVDVSTKISGIHWQYKTPHHGAELTAGYKNDQGEAYRNIANMLKKYNVVFDFTCFEMKDNEQPGNACSSPESLVGQTLNSAAGLVDYQGENALPRYDTTAYNTIKYEATRVFPIHAFSYLRLGNNLLQGSNWANFKNFVNNMNNVQSSNATNF